MSVLTEVKSGAGPLVLLVSRQDGRAPTARQCEEAGEDFGMFDPQVSRSLTRPRARLVTEGYTGALCTHQWGFSAHFGRNPYGTVSTCVKCGVKVRNETPQRGTRTTFTYDGIWELREPIWKRWVKRGPVPGALQPQAHHGVSRE